MAGAQRGGEKRRVRKRSPDSKWRSAQALSSISVQQNKARLRDWWCYHFWLHWFQGLPSGDLGHSIPDSRYKCQLGVLGTPEPWVALTEKAALSEACSRTSSLLSPSQGLREELRLLSSLKSGRGSFHVFISET